MSYGLFARVVNGWGFKGEHFRPWPKEIKEAMEKLNKGVRYENKRTLADTHYCDICGRKKQKIHAFENNGEVGNDSHYLACTVCKRP